MTRPVQVWVDPPSTALPLRKQPFRVAVGTPHGASSNSWKVWKRGLDVYVACRDNFQQLKASLHASGNWRFGLTKEAQIANAQLVTPGEDRAWKKWRPIFTPEKRIEIGFQIAVPRGSLYLSANDRQSWPRSVLFVEPEESPILMVVVSVCIVLGQAPVVFGPNTHGAVIALEQLDHERTLQLVVTHEDLGNLPSVISEAIPKIRTSMSASGAEPLDKGVLFLHGSRGEDVPYVMALPFRTVCNEAAT